MPGRSPASTSSAARWSAGGVRLATAPPVAALALPVVRHPAPLGGLRALLGDTADASPDHVRMAGRQVPQEERSLRSVHGLDEPGGGPLRTTFASRAATRRILAAGGPLAARLSGSGLRRRAAASVPRSGRQSGADGRAGTRWRPAAGRG